jgi:hypothetical protein
MGVFVIRGDLRRQLCEKEDVRRTIAGNADTALMWG